ncbi:hypothetical protein CO725_02530 [Vibrio parahaemolyticus]|uniref:hypothetical protein n=1 Tax=Vibrio parahaemolyticus TaxID=670 RepID=UPI000BE45DC1|nr:hypothetical protein [Vibrio parahaemolyticus]ATI44550.1 hypothetical protein CO725_02530 [Vibrio parahaemolyticus]
MKKMILSIFAACFFVSYAEYVAIIELPTTNEAIKPPIEPDIPTPEPTPGGCDGTGIIKIKNIIEDGQTWKDSAISITGSFFYSNAFPELYEIKNNCWGNSETETIQSLILDANKKSSILSMNTETWNDADTLYLRFVEAGDALPVLRAYNDSGWYSLGWQAGKPEDDVNIDKWTNYVAENKLLEYSIQVSEVPYN